MARTQEARVVLEDGMVFRGYGDPEEEQFAVHMDAKPEFGGQGKGLRPQSLLLTSLAGCTAMDVISILRKKRQDVTGLEVRVQAEKAEQHPRVYTHIWLTYVVSGKDIDRAAVERAVELSLNNYCPVANLVRQVVPIETAIEIVAE